jgi:predicted metal-dependent HD superfamily phosphohydrolase
LRMDITSDLLQETAAYVESLFSTNETATSEFRNFQMTVKLVQTGDFIAVNTDLPLQDLKKLLLASWFQYTGVFIDPKNYQEESCKIARTHCTEKGLSPGLIQEIEELILATRYPQQPLTVQAQILCDAENSWLAGDTFFKTLEYVRKDKLRTGGKDLSEKEWLTENIQMFENHIYFVPFARKTFDKNKAKNRQTLVEKLNSKLVESEKLAPFDEIKLERGVETLFRNTSRNQIHLIRLADYKANLIISVNAIIISVVLSFLIVRLDANKYLELPTLLLIITNVITILIAISATRPRLKLEKMSLDHLQDAEKNILFFGNFYKMPFNHFKRVIRETITDKTSIYDNLTKDIYFQGIMLLYKFKKINLSYLVFSVGLILSVLTFIFSFLHHIHQLI